jgi:CheY-like chemotaxis protein
MDATARRGASSVVHVLVVDDDDSTRAMLRAVLVDHGHEVSEARDGRAALGALRASQHPSVVLLDYLMPQHSGVEFLREVAADPALASRHRFVVMTAIGADQVRLPDEVRTLPASPVVFKPFELGQLFAAIDGAARLL